MVLITPDLVKGQNMPQPKIRMDMVSEPTAQLTTNWCFLVDTSHSMRGVFDKARLAFFEATSYPTDQLRFSVITFDNRGMERFQDWKDASQEEFRKTSNWIREREEYRILSYGVKAIEMALDLQVQNLTILVISDGGFTEVSTSGRRWDVIREAFSQGQQRRLNRGLGSAIITTIGIENPEYRAGNKPSDAECQAFLKEIGERYAGGYFLVHDALQAAGRQ